MADAGDLCWIGPVTAGAGGGAIAVEPLGRAAYVTDAVSSKLLQYNIDRTTGADTHGRRIGAVPARASVPSPWSRPAASPIQSTAPGKRPASPASTGALGTSVLTNVGRRPSSVAIDPLGKFAYAVNNNDSNVYAYRVDSATGLSSSMTQQTTGSGPRAVVLSR